MNVVVFGATGMVGKGVLLECLDHPDVGHVLVIGRSSCGVSHEKLEEQSLRDFTDYSSLTGRLGGLDACFFCLGVSSVGMSEADYRHVTYDFAIAAAEALVKESPGLTFIYVSGDGTDGTGTSRMMWARVKGETENRLLSMPFGGAYMFRPGIIQPLRGARARGTATRVLYTAFAWLFPILKVVAPNSFTTTERIGRAMIGLSFRRASAEKHLKNADINRIATP